MQLPVYRLAVRQAGDAERSRRDRRACTGWSPAAAGSRSLPLPDDEAAAGRRLRGLVAGAVALVDAGLFPRSTAGPLRLLRRRLRLRRLRVDAGAASASTRCSRRVVALQAAGTQEEGDDG